jgi:hypothetical protein
MRGLKKCANIGFLKENRYMAENNRSKVMMDRNIENARKKSKLIETI